VISKVLTILSDFDSSLITNGSTVPWLLIGDNKWVPVELEELRRPGGLNRVVYDCLIVFSVFFVCLETFLAFIININ